MSDDTVSRLQADLKQAVESALIAESIFQIDSYGWLNEHDHDPEFVGHAMWQTNDLIDDYWLFDEKPPPRRLSDVEKEAVASGADFCGMMKLSRMSIGLAFLWSEQAIANPHDEDNLFWLHHTDSFLKLAIASDRLRDLMIVACSGTSSATYIKQARRNRLYVTPFNEARPLLDARGISHSQLEEPVAVLPDFADEIFAYILRRNAIVHDVATRMAKLMRDNASELQGRYDSKIGFLEQLRNLSDWKNDKRKEIRDAKNELAAWYILLVKISNAVFQIEYWNRILGRLKKA